MKHKLLEISLKQVIRLILKEASAEQWGDDDTLNVLKRLKDKGYMFKRKKPKDSADMESGYIVNPKNLVQEKVIHSAITIAKSFTGTIEKENKKTKTKNLVPYELPGLRKRKMSTIGHALLTEGFVRICVRIPVRNFSKEKIFKKGKVERDDYTIYDVHMYFNKKTKECVMPKFKLSKEIASRVEH